MRDESIQRILMPLDNGMTLVAEENVDPDYPEIYLYLQDAENVIFQDLAFVRPKLEKGDCVQIPGKYEVAVYGDSNSEDYTHLFEIDQYIPETEE